MKDDKLKPIKVIEKNRAAIETMLSTVNGRAISFAIINVDEVEEFAAKAECQLEQILVKKDRVGATALVTGRGPSANSYRYPVATTELSLIRRATGWFLSEVKKVHVYPKTPERVSLRITPKQCETAKTRFDKVLREKFGACATGEQ